MSATPGSRGTDRATPDTIDFVYDTNADGNVAANAIVRDSDWTSIIGDNETNSNEIIEVERVEYLPPRNDDGSMQEIEALRLWDGESYYPHVRLRETMTGYFGPDFHLTTPRFGEPVLSDTDEEGNPGQNPIATATPKYGTSTAISPALVNDGTQIDDPFRVRLHVWRWEGTDSELQNYISSLYGSATFQQGIRMSNPYTGTAERYNRGTPIRLAPGADGGALGQFTRLTGGIDQELPKVWPWATYSENNNATRANQDYTFTTRNNAVDSRWKRLDFDFTDRKEAVIFTHVGVNQPDDLDSGTFVIEDRDEDPEVQLTPNSAHELPLLRPLDGASRDRFSPGQLPVALEDRLDGSQVVWDSGGGFRVTDNGTSIGANNIYVNVHGYKLELES